MDEPDYISIEEVIEITGINRKALAGLRYTGKGPRFYAPTQKHIRYRRSEVLAWLEASARTRTGERASA